MKKIAKVVVGLLLCSTLSNCVNQNGEIDKQTLVGLTGAVGGGVIGSNIGRGHGRTAAIIGGTVLGALLGTEVGKSLDKSDIMYHTNTQAKALELNRAGTSSSWSNPDTGASGYITPTKTFKKKHRYCREFTQTIKVAGHTQQGHGVACRNPDGTWEMINSEASRIDHITP